MLLLKKHARHFDLEDELMASAWRPNEDGSITVECSINIYGPDGQRWSVVGKTIRLSAEDANTRKWARAQRQTSEGE